MEVNYVVKVIHQEHFAPSVEKAVAQFACAARGGNGCEGCQYAKSNEACVWTIWLGWQTQEKLHEWLSEAGQIAFDSLLNCHGIASLHVIQSELSRL